MSARTTEEAALLRATEELRSYCRVLDGALLAAATDVCSANDGDEALARHLTELKARIGLVNEAACEVAMHRIASRLRAAEAQRGAA